MKKFFYTFLFMLIASASFGHIPYVQPYDLYSIKIPSPMEKSMAFYMSFEKKKDVDYLYFNLKDDDFKTTLTLTGLKNEVFQLVTTDENGVTGRKLHLGSLVPGCDVYDDILPAIAVVGPLQEYLLPPDGSVALPFRVDDDEGVYIIQNEIQGNLWYEKFTFKSYFDQEKADIILTRPGKYKVYAWEPMGRTGDYVLEVGYVEVFGLQEILRSLFWIEHLVNDGEISCDLCKRQLKELDGPNPSTPEGDRVLQHDVPVEKRSCAPGHPGAQG